MVKQPLNSVHPQHECANKNQPHLRGANEPRVKIRGPAWAWSWDLARQVERLDWLLEQLPRYADWGFTELYLHLEDAVEFPSLPKVARRGAYSYRQIERLVARAAAVGIGVVPIVNLLGHTQYLIKVPALRDLNELRAPDGSPLPTGQICPLHPRTLEVAEKLLRDMQPFCTTPDRKVHVGLDESFHLGRHPLSRAEIARIGLAAHFARYVGKLRQLTRSLGLRMGMWADMLHFLPEAIPLLPRDLIAYDWYYYPFRRTPKIELFNFREIDLAAPLIAHGIEYWGCPMNGAFRHEPLPHFGDRLGNLASWERRCEEVGASGLLMTGWEPSRLTIETTTLADACISIKATSPEKRLASGVRRVFGAAPQQSRKIAALLMAADAYPFTGYARWEINKHWSLATEMDEARLNEERAFFKKAVCDAARWPAKLAPLAASLRYRLYLAERDWFVRFGRGAADRKRFERAIDLGEAAARAMWSASREPDSRAPNLQLIAADRNQLKRQARTGSGLDARLSGARKNGRGTAYWLSYTVWDFAPGLHWVAVDEWARGKWQEIKKCYTIEFLSTAAKQRGLLRHRHRVPLKTPIRKLRFRVGGLGQVKVGGLTLADSTGVICPRGWQRFRKLGSPIPADCTFPDLTQEHCYAINENAMTTPLPRRLHGEQSLLIGHIAFLWIG